MRANRETATDTSCVASSSRQQAKEGDLHKLASALLAHETLDAKGICAAIAESDASTVLQPTPN
jgi:hypothetical protein